MKEKKVLFALTTDSDVRIENSILAKYKQLYGYIRLFREISILLWKT